MLIEDGTGNGYKALVNEDHMILVRAITEEHVAFISHAEGRSYSIVVEDVGPAAAEYTRYFKNDSDNAFIIDHIATNNVAADVVWKLHKVTGTAAGAAVVTPINMNIGSGNTAEATCRGGAGGVTGLTSSAVIAEWFGGTAYNRVRRDMDGALVMPKNTAIAMEYDAGTGGLVAIVITGHYH